MDERTKIYGAYAAVFLKYDGELKMLGIKLSKELKLTEFYYDNDTDWPYEDVGMCEIMGFEIWLRKSRRFKSFSFSIEIETQISLNESFNDQMYDLSPWLARYISIMCDIDTCVFDNETSTQIFFKKENRSK